MGTNYYWQEPLNVCEHCGRGDGVKLHIGKSSAGWCFGLRVYPDLGINELDDWKARWALPWSKITDEYGHEITPDDMADWITNRSHTGLDLSPDWLAQNYAVKGPNGLARHAYGDARPGNGTYDLIGHEFS